MKRILAVIFFLCLFCLGGTLGFAEADTDLENDFNYTLSNDTVTVTGYMGQGGKIDIPSSFTLSGKEYPVTAIGNGAFKNNTTLTSVIIPKSVTAIGKNAFSNCTSLTSVTIPEGVTGIGEYAFQECTGLTAVTIPGSVTAIGERAFTGCIGLTGITIPDSVTAIGPGMFAGCSSLTSVTIPEGVTSIGAYAFYGCTGLAGISISEGVTSIGAYAFYGCTGLTNVTIPKGVTSIGEAAFAGCAELTGITIPEGVTSIGRKAFYGCTGLMAVTIPEGVTAIGEGTFYHCTGLTEVTIPASVTGIGEKAFYGCSGLMDVAIPGGVTDIEKNAFESSGLTAVTIPRRVASIGKQAFLNCGALKKVYYEGTQAEWGTLTKGVDLGLSDAARIVFQTACTVTFKVEYGAWNDGDTADKTVTLSRWDDGSAWEKLDAESIPKAGGNPDKDYSEGGWQSPAPAAGMEITGDTTFTYAYVYDIWQQDGYVLKRDGGKLAITLYRGDGADVDIPAKFEKDGIEYPVIAIGENAFSNCEKLTSVKIPEGVQTIGSNAFDGCRNLKSATVPSTVTEIGSRVFNGCTSLSRLYYNGTREEWEDGKRILKDTNWKKGVTVGFTLICRASYSVTFRVENGAWNDGNVEEKSLTLTGWEDETKWKKLKAADIPKAGANPDEDYTKGGWMSPGPAAGMEITQPTIVYTYAYTAIDYSAALGVIDAVNALPTPANVTLTDSADIAAVREDYNALDDVQKAKVSSETLKELEAAEQALEAAVAKEAADIAAAQAATDTIDALPAPEDVQLTDKAAVDRARAYYNALTADQKAKVSDETRKELEAAGQAISILEAAQAVTDTIDALPAPEDVQLTDKTVINEASAEYNALTDEEKAKVSDETLEKLEAAGRALNNLEAAQAVTDAIAALPAPEDVQLTDKAAIHQAQADYNALTADQKAKVSAKTLKKLEAAGQAISILEAARAVTDAIKALPAPENVKLTDKAFVEKARAEHTALTGEQKAKISDETLKKLEAAEQAVSILEAARAVIDVIDALPAPGDVQLTDKEAIHQARADYNALTDEQKAKVSVKTLKKLENAEQAMDTLEAAAAKKAAEIAAAQALAAAIDLLPAPEDVQLTDREAIEKAHAHFKALSADLKASISDETVEKLEAVRQALIMLEAIQTAAGTIDALPAPEDVQLTDKEAIHQARDVYNTLTGEQKAKISDETLKKLEAAEQTLGTLEAAAAKEAADAAAAQAVTDAIDILHAPEDVSLTDKAVIDQARDGYNALTDDQKAKISDETLKKLEAAEQALNILEAAQAVTDAIDALPASENVKLKDKAVIEKARADYNALTEEQKAKVSVKTLKKLENAEQALGILEAAAAKEAADTAAVRAVTGAIDVLPEPKYVDTTNKAAIDEARAAYNALTDDQKAKVSEKTLNRLDAAEQALNALKFLTEEQIAKINAYTQNKQVNGKEAVFK